jgi:hypothetical protein
VRIPLKMGCSLTGRLRRRLAYGERWATRESTPAHNEQICPRNLSTPYEHYVTPGGRCGWSRRFHAGLGGAHGAIKVEEVEEALRGADMGGR